MQNLTFNFYDPTNIKSYNLDKNIRYQLNLLDTLDVFTRIHSENVANITCRLCEYLHCSTEFTIYCVTCAYLHDIGKLFIPASILQKRDKLTPDEYEIMKKHTILGYNLCMKDLQLRPYASVVLNHHEALNGSGYPNGISQDNIPIEAQIVRVADEFDALVSKRQYKTHINISEALNIIIEEATPIDRKSKDISEKLGKVNPQIVRKLFKVVLDDTYYEILHTESYITYLENELKRFDEILKYYSLSVSATTQKKKEYYLNGVEILLKDKETIDIIKELYPQYKNAYDNRKKIIEGLYKEIKIIKRLKV